MVGSTRNEVLLVAAALAFSVALAIPSAAQTPPPESSPAPNERYYLPNPAASRIVSVTATGSMDAEVIVLTLAVAEKETGPAEVVAHFGEIYTFSPSLVVLHRDEPTQLSFWNLQPDDEHDVMLLAPDLRVLMKVALAPLSKTSYVFTFHHEGLFTFHCTFHQPAMSGQILVLPPRSTANH
jgi:plastocyanin